MKMARASCSINRGNSSSDITKYLSQMLKLADFHGPVGPAREEPRVRVQVDLGDALADTFEETGAGVFSGEIVQQLVQPERPGDPRHNWVLRVGQLLDDAWCVQHLSATGVQQSKSEFARGLESVTRSVDMELNSSHSQASRNSGSLEGLAAGCLEKELTLHTERVLVQVRLAGDKFCRISWEGLTHESMSSIQTDPCQVCNLCSQDTLAHLNVFLSQRTRHLGEAAITAENLLTLLQLEEPSGLFKFLRTALRLRLCAMSEDASF
ncbi:unnamed protein product [Nesidiocoris tenuis]|uniref:Uncharacterized protein n=1 Tax=Nesidiocoris tenuis TaxID=355587 RepID=A0A6H5GA73_9HEMI|nr:unnamed protein product [Nesidiocoris tenuis]